MKNAAVLLVIFFAGFIADAAPGAAWTRGGYFESDLEQRRASKLCRDCKWDAGGIDLGQSTSGSFFIQWNGYKKYSLSGGGSSGPFSVYQNACKGGFGGSGSCTFMMRFKPGSAGPANGKIVFNFRGTEVNNQGQEVVQTGSITWNVSGAGLLRPPVEERCIRGSIIRPHNRSLGEIVPLVGVPYSLVYSSLFSDDYVPEANTYEVQPDPSFNSQAWNFSIHHSYNFSQRRLFLGTGTVESRAYAEFARNEYIVISSSGDEAYIFNPKGRHLRTLKARTGVVKYTFRYDQQNRLQSIFDEAGNQSSISRDGGRMVQFQSPFGRITRFTSNGTGLTSVTNPNNETYRFSYVQGKQLLEKFTKPGGQTSTFSYDGKGRLVSDAGPGGTLWRLSVDGDGNILRRSKLGRMTILDKGYSEKGEYIRRETSPEGLVSVHRENQQGDTIDSSPIDSTSTVMVKDVRFGELHFRPLTSTYKVGAQTSVANIEKLFTPATNGTMFNYIASADAVSVSGRRTLDSFRRDLWTRYLVSPESVAQTILYNTREQPTSVQLGSDTARTISYDQQGRVSSTQEGAQNRLIYTYGADGFLSSVQNARGEVTNYFRNPAGRVTELMYPDRRSVKYTYDPNGNLTGVRTPAGILHSFEFNAMDLMSKYAPPIITGVGPTETSYSYDQDRQLTEMRRPDGLSARYLYQNSTGLLNRIEVDGGAYIYTYDPRTFVQIKSLESPSGVKNTFTYQGPKLASDSQAHGALVGKVSFEFDVDQRVIARTVQGNTGGDVRTAITLNKDDKPTVVGEMSLSYDARSGRLLTADGLGVSETRSYDSYGNLQSYRAVIGAQPNVQILYSYTLDRDVMSRIVGKTETILGETSVYVYNYDTAGRLTSVMKDSVLSAEFEYDLNGNRTHLNINGVSAAAEYDEQDRLISMGARTYEYGKNGDLSRISAGAGMNRNFKYDVFGNLVQATTTAGPNYDYLSDGMNRRVARKVNGVVEKRYLYEGQYRIVGETNAVGGLQKVFVYATGGTSPDYMVNSGQSYRIISDHLGSPRLVVRGGTIVQRMDYDILGRVLADTNPGLQPFGFAGGFWDSQIGLVRFGARDYDPETGRWTSKDPILFNGGQANLYGYVMNDPVNLVDVDGMRPLPIFGNSSAGQGAVAGAIAGGTLGSILPGLGTATGVVGGGIVGGLLGGLGGIIGGDFGSAVDAATGAYLGLLGGTAAGSLAGPGTAAVGGIVGGAAAGAYCSDKVHTSDIISLINGR